MLNDSVIVVVAHYNEDLSWVQRIKYKHIIYSKTIKSDPSVIFQPLNKGNEASAYFQYILDNYNTLPEYVFFVHGHDTSWHHEGSIVDIINNTDLTDYRTLNKFPLAKIDPESPDPKRAFQDIGIAIEHPPDTNNLYYESCAMMCVSRENIRNRSFEFYLRFQTYLLTTNTPNFNSSRVAEYTWRWIFLQTED